MNFKIIRLVTGLVLTATLASCSSNVPTGTQSVPSSPAANTAPDNAMQGDAMKGEGNAMEGKDNAMKGKGNAMEGKGNAMEGGGNAMKDNAMKGDAMSPSPTTNP